MYIRKRRQYRKLNFDEAVLMVKHFSLIFSIVSLSSDFIPNLMSI